MVKWLNSNLIIRGPPHRESPTGCGQGLGLAELEVQG